MHRIARRFAIGVTAALLLVWGALWLASAAGNPAASHALARIDALVGYQTSGAAGAMLPGSVQIGGPFRLVNQNGTAVTDADYRGRWMLVYFGYTFCPDVCPTELQTIAAAVDKLGPDAAKVAPLFITVDPARDTPAVLAKYVALFGHGITGLTGTPDEIAAVARAFRVYYAKAPVGGTATYLMDHSSFVYLLDPKGRLAALFNQDTSADELAAGLRERLSQRT
jgi:cytochrome oxidase Cu insertion factor (SCO1/SenC/PrrC family)